MTRHQQMTILFLMVSMLLLTTVWILNFLFETLSVDSSDLFVV